jgi:hypothetical protein
MEFECKTNGLTLYKMTAAKSIEVKTEKSKSRKIWQNLLRKAIAKQS